MITDRTKDLIRYNYQLNKSALQTYADLKVEYPELSFQDIATEFFKLRKQNIIKRGKNYGK